MWVLIKYIILLLLRCSIITIIRPVLFLLRRRFFLLFLLCLRLLLRLDGLRLRLWFWLRFALTINLRGDVGVNT